MKTSFFLTAFCIMSLSVFLIWNKVFENNRGTAITVNENDDDYSFSASFDKAETRAVWLYINQNISPNSLGKSENDYFDVTTSLTDKTAFYIKESPGELKIELDKRKNTTASYNRIKSLCNGVKDILGGK